MTWLVVGAMALLAACVGGPPVPTHGDPSDGVPDYAAVFGTDRVHALALRMDGAVHATMMREMEALQGAPFGGGGSHESPSVKGPVEVSPSWYPVTVAVGTRTWEGVGFRLKGNSSLRAAWQGGIRKLPFRLDVDRLVTDGVGREGQGFFGFGELSFANGFGDPTLMRDVLASEILEDRGVPAARAAYWKVTLDTGAGPEPLGLYVALEVPEDTLLARIWGDDAGNLYKPDGPCASVTCFDEASFEKETNTAEADWSDVRALHAALNGDRSDSATWRAALAAELDVDGFLRWLAVNTALHNWDAYGAIAHNYHLYGPPADGGRLAWIPWDHNEVLTDKPAPGDDPLLAGVDASWPLIRFLLDDPAYAATYRAHLLDALEGAYAAEAFEARVESLAELLRPALYGKDGEPQGATFVGTEAEFDEAVRAGLVEFAALQRARVTAAVGAE